MNHVNETWSVFGFQSQRQYDIALENSMQFDGPDLNVFLTGEVGGGKAFLGGLCRRSPTNERSSIAGWAGEDGSRHARLRPECSSSHSTAH